ncbi:hypothetical protein C8Q78DRAFT_665136 [Trametes maxima]|nr:hypothetical protein C8Q78DRAFT_665136 [Trametes maxima]
MTLRTLLFCLGVVDTLLHVVPFVFTGFLVYDKPRKEHCMRVVSGCVEGLKMPVAYSPTAFFPDHDILTYPSGHFRLGVPQISVRKDLTAPRHRFNARIFVVLFLHISGFNTCGGQWSTGR